MYLGVFSPRTGGVRDASGRSSSRARVPKIRDPFLGVPIMRIVVPPILICALDLCVKYPAQTKIEPFMPFVETTPYTINQNKLAK